MMKNVALEQHAQDEVQQQLQEVCLLLQKSQIPLPPSSSQDLLQTLHQQYLDILAQKIVALHPADLAYVLEALPLEQRLRVWQMVPATQQGDVLLEVPEVMRELLIATMNADALKEAATQLDADELADLALDLPQQVMRDVFKSLSVEEREQLRAAMSYEEDRVGALMDFNMIQIREDVSLEVVARYLRRFEVWPDHADVLFVTDRDDRFKGVLPLSCLIVQPASSLVSALMLRDVMSLEPEQAADKAAQLFERYELISAPVVDDDGRLLGRLTVNAVLDFVRRESASEHLNQVGLRTEEDIFASVWKSAQNRGWWLALNLCTAFVASRVIGGFEHSIQQLVALATLLPIVAGLAGNTANQTNALVVRALALGLMSSQNAKRMLQKELAVALLNGLVWGSIAGLFAWLLYRNGLLGVVMMLAIVFNLLCGAIIGSLIPQWLHRQGRDPAIGSGVLITAITDSGGFFIFLGLATLLLL